jgi:hypothetical protein
MENLKDKLLEKGLSESSVKMYLRNLEKLNDSKPLKNLNFLKKPEVILEKIKDKKENTRRSYLISIVSVLGVLEKDSPLYKKYHSLMLDINNQIKNKPTDEMSESQSKNWKKWDDVLKDFNDLKERVLNFKGKVYKNQYNDLLNLLVAGLYIYQEPRRNMDYQKMYKVKKYDVNLPNDVNYIDENNFIFNIYKTSKKYGQKIIPINEELKPLLKLYYKYTGKPTKVPEPFLVDFDKKPLDNVNSITRILNKVFNKKIGSSMLRHIYITHKFGDKAEEMKKTADNMGHTVETQKDYIKDDSKVGGSALVNKLLVDFD